MGEFVRQQKVPIVAAEDELMVTENNVASDRVRSGVNRLGRVSRSLICVHANS